MIAQTAAPPKRVLVIRLQNHGDVLLTTPVFSTLRSAFPAVEVDALVYAETLPIVAANPDLTQIWALPRGRQAGRGMARMRRLRGLLLGIRRRKYDWVLHLNDQWFGALAALVSGARLRFSYDMAKRDYWLWRRIFPVRIAPTAEGHMVEQNLRVLKYLGLDTERGSRRCTMGVSAADEVLARQRLAEAGVEIPYILVHPTSRWFFKCWEDDRLANVIATLVDEGHRVVLTSGPEPKELALVESLMARVDHPGVKSLAGKLTLPALAAVIGKADLFLGVDSVPMHIAAAMGVPIVALFGPTHVHIWRPWTERAVVVHAADFGPLIEPNSVDTATKERYLGNIPVAPVLAAIHRQLARRWQGEQ